MKTASWAVALYSEEGTKVAKLQGKFLAAGEFAGLAIVLGGAPRATQLLIDRKAGVDARHESTSQQLTANHVYDGITLSVVTSESLDQSVTALISQDLNRRGRCAIKIRARA